MAYYHKGLKYHEDTTEKHQITQEEVEFLCKLQKEMNTQDTCGNAEPRFWVIKGSEERVTADGYGDSTVLFDNDAAETVARTMRQAYEYLKEVDIEEIKEVEFVEYDEFIKVKCDEGCFGEQEEELTTMEEVSDFLNGFHDVYRAITFEKVGKIYQDTMFLTQKEAEEHLKENSYHYSEDAHTYAMTAWRSPDVERLWKILMEVDWERMKMSMISEQIKRLREKAKLFKKSGFATDGIAKEFEDAAKTIEELSEKLHDLQMERSSKHYNGGWIPRSERLPEENTRVLTTIKINKHPGNVRSGYYAYKMFHNDNGDCWDYNDKEVIAWMPLPTNYQGEENG